jgi:hypothetical protein
LNRYDYGFRDYDPLLMRWTTEDPIRDWQNWYAYCENDPVNFIDLWGLNPGDPFPSADAAATDWAETYNDDSIRSNKELGSSIYKTDEGYKYTTPNTGTKNNVKLSVPENNEEVVAKIHSHANATNPLSDTFSDEDLHRADQEKVDSYVSTGYGNLDKYDHETKEVSPLSNDISYDSKNSDLYENNPDAYKGTDDPKNSRFESIIDDVKQSTGYYNSGGSNGTKKEEN